MQPKILIVGGTGQIGLAVARDLAAYSQAQLTITGRNQAKGEARARDPELKGRAKFIPLDLQGATDYQLQELVSNYDLAIQCAGPFRQLPPRLLQACINAQVNYVDVCDDAAATQLRLTLDADARASGITALIDTGTFPGIDNVMVADALARHPDADRVNLHFVCAGSGGGGFGVLETTFLAVSRPYLQLHNGRWLTTPSYRQRRVVDFGPPLGNCAVYNFEVPEIWSLTHSFPQLRTCTSQFGTLPAIWNWATSALASAPERIRTDSEFLTNGVRFMLPIVHWVDRWVGSELGIRVEVHTPTLADVATFYAPSTSEAVGWATGAAALMVLNGEIGAHGVLLPETYIPPAPYFEQLTLRGGRLNQEIMTKRPLAAS